jgi:CRISPR-associated protein (TIGR03984 family)
MPIWQVEYKGEAMETKKVKVKELDHRLDFSAMEKFWKTVHEMTIVHNLKYALSHHDDGVIWGAYQEGWQLSENKNTSPQFHLVTLLQCRFFGKDAELFIWRSQTGFKSRLLVEGEGKPLEFFDRNQILWGDKVEAINEHFTLMREGEQGMEHLFPLSGVNPRAGLIVRAYIDYDDRSNAFIRWHRLTGLKNGLEPIDYRNEG